MPGPRETPAPQGPKELQQSESETVAGVEEHLSLEPTELSPVHLSASIVSQWLDPPPRSRAAAPDPTGQASTISTSSVQSCQVQALARISSRLLSGIHPTGNLNLQIVASKSKPEEGRLQGERS
jgi:hypothetical protein